MPPLFYPTHSTAMILSAVNSYARRVSCFGCRTQDPAFSVGGNPWDNEFINQYVFMELANGGTARINEAYMFLSIFTMLVTVITCILDAVIYRTAIIFPSG